MPPVDGASVLAALISQEIGAARRRRSLVDQQPVDPRVDSQGNQAPQQVRDELTLQQRIARRASSIDGADPDRHSKGLKLFLEAVLLDEFGSELVEDPSFHDLLARVHASMMKSEALADPIRRAISELFGCE